MTKTISENMSGFIDSYSPDKMVSALRRILGERGTKKNKKGLITGG